MHDYSIIRSIRKKSNWIFGFILIVLCVQMMSSCTIQKRVHRKGWFVQWHHQKKESGTAKTETTQSENTPITTDSNKKTSKTTTESTDLKKDDLEKDDVSVNSDEKSKSESLDSQKNKTISEEISEESIKSEREKKGELVIPFAVIAAAVISAGVVIALLGASPFLVPIILSIISAFNAIVSIKRLLNEKDEIVRTKSIRKQLIEMFVTIVLAFGITTLLVLTDLPAIINVVVLFVSLFALLIVASRKQSKLDKKEAKEHPVQEKAAPEKNENVSTKDQEQSPQQLSIGKAFPNLSGSIFFCTYLTFILLIVLVIAYSLITPIGGVFSPYIYLIILLPIFTFLLAIMLGVKRQRLYKAYKMKFDSIDSKKNETTN